jgi:hypothetical protein
MSYIKESGHACMLASYIIFLQKWSKVGIIIHLSLKKAVLKKNPNFFIRGLFKWSPDVEYSRRVQSRVGGIR